VVVQHNAPAGDNGVVLEGPPVERWVDDHVRGRDHRDDQLSSQQDRLEVMHDYFQEITARHSVQGHVLDRQDAVVEELQTRLQAAERQLAVRPPNPATAPPIALAEVITRGQQMPGGYVYPQAVQSLPYPLGGPRQQVPEARKPTSAPVSSLDLGVRGAVSVAGAGVDRPAPAPPSAGGGSHAPPSPVVTGTGPRPSWTAPSDVKVHYEAFAGPMDKPIKLVHFLSEFEEAAINAGWSEERKGNELRARLKGAPLELIRSMTLGASPRRYEVIRDALYEAYIPQSVQETAKYQLNDVHQATKTPTEYAQHLRELYLIAYPPHAGNSEEDDDGQGQVRDDPADGGDEKVCHVNETN